GRVLRHASGGAAGVSRGKPGARSRSAGAGEIRGRPLRPAFGPCIARSNDLARGTRCGLGAAQAAVAAALRSGRGLKTEKHALKMRLKRRKTLKKHSKFNFAPQRKGGTQASPAFYLWQHDESACDG